MITPTEAEFLKDVATHEMRILRDHGAYREIYFKRPNTICMSFRLITWPGCLCYTGDMGTYVFRRLEDMFQFFRTDRREPGDAHLHINPQYWAEKLLAVDRNSAPTEFSADKFRAEINRWLTEREEFEATTSELRKAVEDEVLYYADDGEQRAQHAARDFEYKGEHIFQDFFEVNCHEYTHTYLWCCYAIAWGIQQYDALPLTQRAAHVPTETQSAFEPLRRVYLAQIKSYHLIVNKLAESIAAAQLFIEDDATAMQFQTLGQYRDAIKGLIRQSLEQTP